MTRLLALAAMVLMLVACAPRTSVRVDPAPGTTARPAAAPARGEYVVVRGDTLYGIAFRHGMDYRELARINAINPPYTIYPGQRLRLGDARPAVAAAPPPSTPATTPARPPASTSPGVVAPIVSQPAQPATGRPATTAPPVAAPTTPSTPPASTPAPSLPTGPLRWQWPADGPIVGTFVANDPTRQGLGIGGSAGQPVRAAADGVVVYSGAGLIGYGELVIVKHSDEWLSAYGHNRRRLVAEGDSVRGGQQIAEMGRSGASRDMLHFEIRRNGRPVDPVGLLPRR